MLSKCCQNQVLRIKEKSQIAVLQQFGIHFKWCHQESNRGHKDFQSFALPTELWHLPFAQPYRFCECKDSVNFLYAKNFFNFFYFYSKIVPSNLIIKACNLRK